MTLKQIIKGKGNKRGNKPKLNIAAIGFYCKNKRCQQMVFNTIFAKLIGKEFKYLNVKFDTESKIIYLQFQKEKTEHSYKLQNAGISANALIKQINADVCEKWFRVEYLKDNTYTAELDKPLA